MSDLDILSLLGGPRALGGKKLKGPLAWHDLVLDGLPGICVISFKDYAGLSTSSISDLLGVSEKTYFRVQAHPNRPIDPVMSDRLVRAAKVMALAEEVLESREEAIGWMGEQQAALGNAVPRDLLTTDTGAKQVEDLLLRMEHGYLA